MNTLPSNTFFAKTVLTSQCATSTPTPSSSSSSSSSAATGQTSPTPTGAVADGQNAGDGQQKDDESSKGLGSGAIAGIVVGCVGGLALVAGAVGAVLWRRRKNHQAAAGQEPSHGAGGDAPGYSPNGYYQAPGDMQQQPGYADSSVGGYSGSTAGGGGYYEPAKAGQYAEPQMKENTVYTPPAELPHENRHLIGDQRADAHEMP